MNLKDWLGEQPVGFRYHWKGPDGRRGYVSRVKIGNDIASRWNPIGNGLKPEVRAAAWDLHMSMKSISKGGNRGPDEMYIIAGAIRRAEKVAGLEN